MTLELYFHPLSSFCWKALIALYEAETPFEPRIIDFGNPEDVTALTNLWPIRKFPVLRDHARELTIGESTSIIEYLAIHYPGRGPSLVAADAESAWLERTRDRFFDLHVHVPMQKITGDRLRSAGDKDPCGVERAKALMTTALGMAERDIAGKTWALGERFGMADCSAAPALFYANKVMPFEGHHPKLAAYLERLSKRASFARVLEEAQPYFKNFPG